ncbi:hypothetical protein BSKO_06562 [Bryopsis sp. KO-2023]|nr:hypothetical protein BSKO_06562 [Bryopsis sp. KO-2023]
MLVPLVLQVGSLSHQTRARRRRTRMKCGADVRDDINRASGSHPPEEQTEKKAQRIFETLVEDAAELRVPYREASCEPSTSTSALPAVNFIERNNRITGLARNALETIKANGPRHRKAQWKVNEVLLEFESISKRPETLSHVNISTLVHRTAVIATKAGIVESVLTERAGLIENLVRGVKTWEAMLEPRHVANVIWGFGKLGRRLLMVSSPGASFPVVLSGLMQKAEREASGLRAQEISNVIIGLVNLGFKLETSKCLLDRLVSVALQKADKFNPQEVANFVWAIARIGYKFGTDWSLIIRFEQKFYGWLRKGKVSDQQLSNFVWGLAKLGYENGSVRFYNLVVEEMKGRLHGLTSQGMSNLLWALSKLRYLPSSSALQMITEHVVSRMHLFRPQHVANVLYAYAIFGEPSENLTSAAKSYFAQRGRSFSSQELCNLMWALATLDDLDVETFTGAMELAQSKQRLSIENMGGPERRQMYQCLMHLCVFCGLASRDVASLMSTKGEKMCRDAYQQGQEQKMVYPIALAVLLTLEKMGLVSQCRYMSEYSPYVVDSAVTVEGVRVAVEVSLPTHYFMNNKGRLKGPRSWAMRILEAQGLVILRVDCTEWNRLPAKSRVAHLRQKLEMIC